MSKILLGENREGGDIYLESRGRDSLNFELKGCCESFCLKDGSSICGIALEGDVILSVGDEISVGYRIAGIYQRLGSVYFEMEMEA